MNLFLFNMEWMALNLYLAILPVIFCWFLFKMPHRFYTILIGILWILYLPNTIYVFTDLHHLIEQWSVVSPFGKVILIYQYALLEIIGLSCFLLAFYPIEKLLRKYDLSKDIRTSILITLNFLMGFAMVLGKVERVNSWDVFINPLFVITSGLHLFTSYELLALGILFGAFANFFYFLFRSRIKKLYTIWTT